MASGLPLLLLLLLYTVGGSPLKLEVSNLRASGLRPDQTSNADGFVIVDLGSVRLGQTNVYHDSPKPEWDEKFSYSRALEKDLLKLRVMDKDVIVNDELGVCKYNIKTGTFHPTCSLKTGGTLSFTYKLA